MVNALLSAYEKGDIKSLVKLLEKSAISASNDGNIEQFEKSYQQLRPLYSSSSGAAAQNKNVITALHLLMLLSESNISQFHSELESLSDETLKSAEIQWVNNVEQGIMEGSYQEVRNLLSKPPGKAFDKWGSLMIGSIRAEIAECSASAYESLPLVNLTTLLMLKNVKETQEFAGERGWLVKDGRVVFPKKDPNASTLMDSDMQVDGQDTVESARELLITQTLGYARELESIV